MYMEVNRLRLKPQAVFSRTPLRLLLCLDWRMLAWGQREDETYETVLSGFALQPCHSIME